MFIVIVELDKNLLTMFANLRDSSNILAGLGLVKGGNGRERKIGVPFAPDRSKATKAIQRRTKDDSVITRSHTDNGKETISKVLRNCI